MVGEFFFFVILFFNFFPSSCSTPPIHGGSYDVGVSLV